jgi:hypothetical protein
MVCLQLGAQDELQHVECLHSTVLDAACCSRLSNRDDGLALRLARHCRHSGRLPAMLDAGPGADALKAGQGLAPFQGELRELGWRTCCCMARNACRAVPPSSCCFGLPHRPRRARPTSWNCCCRICT